MLVVAYIGFGNSVCRYHLPYVERRKDTIKVKYIYRRMEDRVGDENDGWGLFFCGLCLLLSGVQFLRVD